MGVLILMVMMFSSISLAAYPEDLEDIEDVNYDDLIQLISQEPMDESKMIQDDVYALDQDVVIDKIVDGNVYAMGQNVKIEGANIFGNVFVMAEKVEIVNSQIGGSVFAMGETVNFSGSMNDVYVAGNRVNFNQDCSVWRNAKVSGGTINVNGEIGRDFTAFAETLNVAETAKITGKLNYSSDKEGTISENAQIGDVAFEQAEPNNTYQKKTGDYVFDFITIIARTLVIAVIIVFLVKKFKNLYTKENGLSEYLKSIGKGIGVLIVVPVISVLLMISLIGAGLGVSLLAIYIVIVYLATSIFAVEVAYRFEKENKAKIIGIAILVSIIVKAISFIHTIGGTIVFLTSLIGLGTLFDMIFKKVKNEAIDGE